MVEILPFVDEGLGNSSYLVEIGDRRALVVDPPRDIAPFRDVARSRGLALSHAVETHLHADFVSGSRELAASGAEVIAPRASGLAFPHIGLEDGEELDLGRLRLRAIGTPGHTPEHLSYLLLDGSRPLVLFSGGALLPGSVARTDLIAPNQTERLARALYHALHERLFTLPDDLPVYPTHGAGSFCSSAEGGERTTTIGRERATNPLLAAPDEETFVNHLLGAFGTFPTYFQRLREVNRQGPKVYGDFPGLTRLDLRSMDRQIADGAELIDVRPIDLYAAGHIKGSLSITLRPAFASWLGWLVEPDRSLVFVLEGDQDRSDLVRQSLGIGYERLAGELLGGIPAWRGAGRPIATTLLTRTPVEGAAAVVDVRQTSEYAGGHVRGAVSLELGSFVGSGIGALPDGVTLMCGHGERATSAASLAERVGRRATVFEGSPSDWARLGGRRLVRGP